MRVPWSIFRAYDIRGLADGAAAPLTPALVEAIGRAYATLLRRQWGAGQCVAAADQRRSSSALSAALIAGLRGAGLDVMDIGLAPSPLAYWAASRSSRQGRPTGAVVVTASHNPPDQNGIKLLQPSTLPLLPEEIRQLGALIEQGDYERGYGALSVWNPADDYLSDLAAARGGERGLRIAADPGNGVAVLTGPAALAAGGASVEVINAELTAEPAHAADPQHAENVEPLRRHVLERGADLGFAWDGDGDRLGLVDRWGRRAAPDHVLALLARDHLRRHPGAAIHVDVKTSQAVIEEIYRHGGRARLGPVGHSLGKHAMEASRIDFGGEPSGHYFQRIASPPHITDDAVRSACRIVQICARGRTGADLTIEEQLDEIPAWRTSPEIQLPCEDGAKFALAARIGAELAREFPIVQIDGARADCSSIEPGAWVLVRASNTTANLTIRLEARNDEAYRRLRSRFARLLAKFDLDPAPIEVQHPLD